MRDLKKEFIDAAKDIAKQKVEENWWDYHDYCTEEEWILIKHSNNWLRMHHYPMCSKKRRKNIRNRISILTSRKVMEIFITGITDKLTSNNEYFGQFAEYKEPMRPATEKELDSINRYIKSISKPTGINFHDLLDKNKNKAHMEI